MNVLIVTFLVSHSPSGVVTYYQTLARDLRQKGVQVRIIESTDTPWFWNKSLNVLGHLMRRLGRVSWILYDETSYFARTYLAVRQRRKEGFDVIHAQDVRSGVAAYLALGRRVPVVLTCHFNDDPVTELLAEKSLSPIFANWLSRWYRYLFATVKNYIFVSNYAYSKSKHLLPETIHKVILYNTVDIDTEPVAAMAESTGGLRISNVGYIDERKNQKLLILVGDELRRRGLTDFSIWLIGDGPKRGEYEELVKTLNLTDQIQFLGRQKLPWRLVAQTDLYVHTALNDNCPYSILEAFAVRTPVLALPVGGIPELIPDPAGQLQSTNPVLVTDQIMRYFDIDRRIQLARQQASYAQTHFNHEKALTDLLSFYHQSLN